MNLVTKVSMVPLSVFTPEIQLAAPAAPTEIIESYVRQVAIEVAEDSHLLQREIVIETQAGVSDYQLEPPDCTKTLKIIKVCDWLGREYAVAPDQPCTPPCAVSFNDLCGSCAPGAGGFGLRPSVFVSFKQPNELIVRPTPAVDVDLGYTVTISVAPERDACEVDELLYQRYAPTIHEGVLYYLFRIPEQSWTSLALSQAHKREYDKKRSRAQLDAFVKAAGGNYRLTTRRIV